MNFYDIITKKGGYMPSTITHAYFGEDLFYKIPKESKKIINNKKSLMMFSQSMDALMFYNIYSIFPGKNIRNMSSVFHNNKTNEFFSNLITYMKENEYYNDSQTLSFLYGLIAHFSLDNTTHPFIFYKTGLYNKKDKSTIKYNGMHTYMENYIDNYFLLERNKELKVNISSFCFDIKPFSNELNMCIDNSFFKTFNIKNMSKKYYKSLKQMKNFIKLFRIDNYGIKYFFYNLIDIIKPINTFQFKSISYKHNNYDKYDFLNNKKNTWYYPVNKDITYNKSFLELYDEALLKAISIINKINDYFFKDKDININELFHNQSYVTGIDCNSNKNQKFFEF